MQIYAFAYKRPKSGRLRWFLTDPVETERDAIAAMRQRDFEFADVEPYAGPLMQRCYITKCRKPAAGFGGSCRPYSDRGWLPLCQQCLDDSKKCFPWHDTYSRC